jgi:16S rRNA (guanine966-N2)-methyltransferase
VTRIIAGVAGGRRIAVPPGATRPTADRAREGLFSTLEAVRGPLVGARVLDLYAGSGAVGLEAASRGARHVLLVEADPRAVRVLRGNVRALGFDQAPATVEVRAERAERLTGAPAPAAYDVVFADPPYPLGADALRRVLADLARHGWLAADATVVVERASRDPPWSWPPGLVATRCRRYGEATLWYGRAAPPPE